MPCGRVYGSSLNSAGLTVRINQHGHQSGAASVLAQAAVALLSQVSEAKRKALLPFTLRDVRWSPQRRASKAGCMEERRFRWWGSDCRIQRMFSDAH